VLGVVLCDAAASLFSPCRRARPILTRGAARASARLDAAALRPGETATAASIPALLR
jgi:hypothetical protein